MPAEPLVRRLPYYGQSGIQIRILYVVTLL